MSDCIDCKVLIGKPVVKPPHADEMGQFVAKILGTEIIWGRIFQQLGSQYRPPTLVLYDGQVRSACGMGQAKAS